MSAVSARRRRCCSAALPANFMCALRRSASASWPGRDALDTLRQRDPAVPLRVSERVAREKACEHPVKVCHGESCPFARGFSLARGFCDRPPAARAAAVATGPLTREAPRSVAFAHEPCAHYFGQDVARWCDVIVGDYNHCFDSAAMLHGLTIANAWRVGVLVDDAQPGRSGAGDVQRGSRVVSVACDQGDCAGSAAPRRWASKARTPDRSSTRSEQAKARPSRLNR